MRQHHEHGTDRCAPRLPAPRPDPCRIPKLQRRHTQPRRDPLPLALVELRMHAQQPRPELQPASLRPPPSRVVPRTVRRPPQPTGRVQRRTKQRRRPRYLARRGVPQQLPRRTAGHHRLPSVRVVTRWVQRVAPSAPVHRAAHHRHRMARTRLTNPVVIHVQRASLPTPPVHAPRRQHRPKQPLSVRLVRRRREDTLASTTRSARTLPPHWVCASVVPCTGRGTRS